MKKLFNEFKAFINKGSVLDLAVGMIIGSAFTAIVTALVNNILKPLINWIPLGQYGLQTVLREAQTADDGSVIVEALVIDWGAVISAIITFLLTAIVLFIIIKLINGAKQAAEKTKAALNKKEEEAPAEEVKEEVPAEPVIPEPTTQELLKKIVELLEEKK